MILDNISTHSRAKAAGWPKTRCHGVQGDFNSQPREGGWTAGFTCAHVACISTHSRAKAAGAALQKGIISLAISTHSRAKAAGFELQTWPLQSAISTHSRAKAAGWALVLILGFIG